MSLGSGSKIDSMLVAVREADDKIVVYSHLLPYEYPSFQDITWLRVPLIFCGIGIVLFYNYYNKGTRGGRRGMMGKSDPFAQIGGMGGGDMMSGFEGLSSSDMSSLRKLEGVESFDMGEFAKYMGDGGSRGGGRGRGMGMGMGGMGGRRGGGGGASFGAGGPKFGPGARFGGGRR